MTYNSPGDYVTADFAGVYIQYVLSLWAADVNKKQW